MIKDKRNRIKQMAEMEVGLVSDELWRDERIEMINSK
jgi:hypothetical protein